MFVELPADFFAVAERDVDLVELDPDLVFQFYRAGCLFAVLDAELLREEDTLRDILAATDFDAGAFAAVILKHVGGVREHVKGAASAFAGIAKARAGLKAEAVA